MAVCTGIWLMHAPSRACTHARSPDTAAGAEERRLHPKFGSAQLHRVTLRPGKRGRFHRVRDDPVLTEVYLCQVCSCPEIIEGHWQRNLPPRPGDALYTPPYWWHHVQTAQERAALSVLVPFDQSAAEAAVSHICHEF